MAKVYQSISKLGFNPVSTPHGNNKNHPRSLNFTISSRYKSKTSTPSSHEDESFISEKPKKKDQRVRRLSRRLITLTTSTGGWQDKWNCEYVFTLRQLQLADLAEDEQKDADVFINLTVQKHASFGFSIVGNIVTSFSRKCSCCFASYCKELDASFDVWVLPSSRSGDSELPEIGVNDPSVIYVKPGTEVDLDSLVQDAVRLTASAKNTCSESCEKSPVTWQYNDGKKYYDRTWSRLLEMRKAM